MANIPGLHSAEIVAFSTIKLKGAVREVVRALGLPFELGTKICDELPLDDEKEFCAPPEVKAKYPDVFKWVDLLDGVIITCGTHPAGVLISGNPIDEEIGLFTTKNSEYPVSSLDMKGLDELMYVKFDLLGLDNVGILNDTCKAAGIDLVTPDNIDLEDWEVWKDVRDDNTAIFQFDSSFAAQIMSKLFSEETIAKIRKKKPDISLLKLMSFGNALIRPCGASVREDAVAGEFHETGIAEIDDMLSEELGYCLIQEDIMLFLMRFCGYSLLEADYARKKIAKKGGTKELLPAVEEGFIKHSKDRLNLNMDECHTIIDPILKFIEDASRYAFNWSHAVAYSFIGYATGYLRHYYPLEFITTCLNTWNDKEDKTAMIVDFATRNGIKISRAKFRHSRSEYFIDKETKTIYKGMKSIKFMNDTVPEQLFELRNKNYTFFVDLLKEIVTETAIDARQLEILIKLDFFEEFGNSAFLLKVWNMFDKFKYGNASQIKKENVENGVMKGIITRHSNETSKMYTKLNSMEILREIESYISSCKIEDIPIRLKLEIQKEFLGYVDFATGKNEDRFRLLILKITPLLAKATSKTWAYKLNAMSMGSGKQQELTVFSRIFDKQPLMEYDIIKCNPVALEPKPWSGGINWYLNGYSL